MTKCNNHLTAQLIEVDAVEPNPFQYRPQMEAIEEMAGSIQQYGLLHDIIVRPIEGKRHKGIKYQLIDGERRWRAYQHLGRKTIAAKIRPASDIETAIIAAEANEKRKDIPDYFKAKHVERILKLSAEKGEPLSQNQLARKLSVSPTFISNRLKLLGIGADLLEIAKQHPNVMSSLLVIDDVSPQALNPRTKNYLRDELKERVLKGDGARKIVAHKETVEAEIKWQRDSQRPDAHTRKAIAARDKPQQTAKREVETALSELRRHAANLKEWMPETDANTRNAARSQVRGIVNTLKDVMA